MPRITFDTSGLNELAKDCESESLVAGLSSGYRVLLSETNVNEIGATGDTEKRGFLLKRCQRFVHAGECIQSSQWILNAMANRHSSDPEGFDWRQVNVRFRPLEEEIPRRAFLGNDELASELKSDNRATNKEFETLLKAASKKVAPPTWDGADSAMEVLDLLTAEGSPLWRLAADIYQNGAGKAAADIRGFVERCPPFNSLLLAMCVALYQWGAKKATERSVYDAGALDLFMAVYLPYCDTFVTNDAGQFAALHLVAERAGLATEVCEYTTWREKMLLG